MRLQRPTPGALLAAAVLAVSLATAASQGYPCYQEGFYRDPNHCGRFYRCAPVRNRPGVFTLYTFGCPDGTAFDEYYRMCVEPHYDDPCFNQVSRGPAYAPQRPMHPFRAPVRSSFRDGQALPCRRDGFHAHPYDCNRFYRCVRYEQDSFYSIYEFNCPETLVYDEATGTCNYAELSQSECVSNQRQPNNSWSQSNPGSGSSSWSQAGAGPGDGQWGDTHQNIEQGQQGGGGWSQVQGQESVNHGHVQNQPQGSWSGQAGNQEAPQCTREGFFGHPDDCNKFYRCVSNGADSYVVYVFSCGESLVWDEAQSTCNYPYAVEGRCRNAAPGPSEQPTFPEQPQGWPQQGAGGGQPGGASPQQPQGWPSPDTGGSRPPGGSGGGRPQPGGTRPASTRPGDTRPCDNETTTGQQGGAGSAQGRPSNQNLPCPREGFYRNPQYCYKFYRCVKREGPGGFDVYEFDCPDGLVFDESQGNHLCQGSHCQHNQEDQARQDKEGSLVARQEMKVAVSNSHRAHRRVSSDILKAATDFIVASAVLAKAIS
ncbi:hypothetical protein HPB50_024769 [Hyalomma asiaticum]|uniref:Uncharacterized protein n=1 Tax=Hyalomma asiaticum TaxID=266040 RepID=A0ACB7TDX2_HYAAI|nr:hypothetical protein HPB50_024769 [Hyalomma asiaticum]